MRRSARSALALALAAAALAAPPAAAPAPPGSDARPLPVLAPVWLDVFVNEVPRGTLLVHLSGADVWVGADDLHRAGLDVQGGDRVERAGRSLVSLGSLAPGVEYALDEVALSLRLTARAALLGRRRLDLARAQRPEGLLRREAASAYLNWALSGDTDERRAATSELGVSVGPALLLSGASIDETNGAVRGLTAVHWDDTARLLRWSAGDVVTAPADPLAGSALVLGGSVGRDFSLDPYLVRAPYPRTTVFASTPATLEVWIDDTLVRRTRVLPGTIDLENVPVNAGLSEIRTVLRDAFGREESASTHALMGTALLRPGLLDWGVAAGARRERFGTRSFDYGELLGLARVRGGVTPALTLGGRLEGGPRLVSAGGSAALATRVGELEGAAAASHDRGEAGAAAFVAWRKTGRIGGAVAQLRWDSGRYANGSLAEEEDRAVLRASLSGSVPLARRLSLMGEIAGERLRDLGGAARGVLRLFWTFPRGTYAALSASRTLHSRAPDVSEVLLTLSMPVAGGGTAEVQGGAGGGAGHGQVALNRSLGSGPGVGYRLAARGGDGAFAQADLQAQARWGRLEVNHQELDPWTGAREAHTAGRIASGVVLIDGRLFATRPVDGSYALVDVGGAPGVTVSLEGHPVGRTGASGDVLVTGLVPYLANRLAIRDSDVPLTHRVDEVERVVAPRFHGGTVERFQVSLVRAVSGRIVLAIDGTEVPPEWGEVAVEVRGRREVSPIGEGGAFWLDGIPPGTHDALVRWEGRLCRFRFEVQESSGTLDLGRIRCVELLVRASAP